jgi:general secretion pathway protein C
MKRLPLIAGFVLFIALCVSAAYWAMQLFKPATRPVAAPPPSKTEARPEAAASLFGGRATGTAVATNFELRGVVVSGSAAESIAILAATGKPAQAVRVDTEIMPGVKVTEVHPRYVMVTEGGVSKRIELPENVSGQANAEGISVPRTPIPVPAAQPTMPAPVSGMQNPQAPTGQAGAGQPPQATVRGQSGAPSGTNQSPRNNQLQPGTTGVFDPNGNPNLAPGQQATGGAPVEATNAPGSSATPAPSPAPSSAPSGMPGGGHPGLIER